MIIKLVSAFADLDQKLVCAVPDIDLVRKSIANIGKKMFISNMEEYVLRFADEKGENVDYTKPRIDPTKKWNQQGVQAGSILYVLKKVAELSEEEQEKIIADARAKKAEDEAQRSLNEDLEKEQEEKDKASLELAIAEKKKALLAEQQQQQRESTSGAAASAGDSESLVEVRKETPPRTPTPTRSVPSAAPVVVKQVQQPTTSTTTSTSAPPVPSSTSQQQQQQPQQQQFAPVPPTSASSNNMFYSTTTSSALVHSPPPPPSGNITVIDSPHASSSAPDIKSSEALIYQLREQNRTFRDQVFALEQRNRELESRVFSNAYSSESSPAVVAQMQLKLRDAEIEIQRLRNNENFLREQLNDARKNGGAGAGPENSVQSVLDRLDPQTRAMIVEDKDALDSLVERRRQNLASTLSLYQLAHDDVELSKIRIQQEKERRDSLLATSAYGASNNFSSGRPLQITSGGSSTTTSSRRR